MDLGPRGSPCGHPFHSFVLLPIRLFGRPFFEPKTGHTYSICPQTTGAFFFSIPLLHPIPTSKAKPSIKTSDNPKHPKLCTKKNIWTTPPHIPQAWHLLVSSRQVVRPRWWGARWGETSHARRSATCLKAQRGQGFTEMACQITRLPIVQNLAPVCSISQAVLLFEAADTVPTRTGADCGTGVPHSLQQSAVQSCMRTSVRAIPFQLLFQNRAEPPKHKNKTSKHPKSQPAAAHQVYQVADLQACPSGRSKAPNIFWRAAF